MVGGWWPESYFREGNTDAQESDVTLPCLHSSGVNLNPPFGPCPYATSYLHRHFPSLQEVCAFV